MLYLRFEELLRLLTAESPAKGESPHPSLSEA